MNAGPEHRFVWVDHVGATTVATSQQVTQFDRDGWFVIERAFHRDSTDEVLAAISVEHGLPGSPLRSDDAPADVLRRFCSHPLLAGLARDLVGPDARVAGHEAIVRDARPHSPALAQDLDPAGRPVPALTCWVTLTDVTADGGALQVARGAHRRGAFADQPAHVVEVTAPAGSVVVMSSLTPRRFLPSSSDQVAVTYAIRYVSDAIDLDDPARRHFPVVRGGQLVGPS